MDVLQKDSLKKVAKFIVESLCIYSCLVLLLSFIAGRLIYKSTESLIMASFLLLWIKSLVKANKSVGYSFLVFMLMLTSVLVLSYKANEITGNMSAARYLCHVCSLSSLLVLLSAYFNNNFFKGMTSGFIVLISMLIVMLFWGFYTMTGGWFSPDTMLAIMQTNLREAKEYMQDYFSMRVVLTVVFFALIGIIVWKNIRKVELRNNIRYKNITVLITLFAIILVGYKSSNNIVSEVFYNARSNLRVYNDFRDKQAERKQQLNLEQNIKVLDSYSNGIYVLVIGESANRDVMSAYGYEKETTPWLDSMKENDNFVLLNNAYSCHTHTVQVLTYALTAKNQYNNLDVAKAPSLVEMAEAAGYDTAWLSNQVKYGAWDTPITVIASEANHQSWINHNSGASSATNYYDLKLVDELKGLGEKGNMPVVIHLMGSHNSYDQRYPMEFAKFSSKNDLGKYENSILYTDYVLGQIYTSLKQMPNFQCLVYFSDHADDVKNGLGHNASRFSWPMTHIPAFICFSEDYSSKRREVLDQLKKAKDEPFTNDLMFELMLGLMGIKSKEFYSSTNDIGSLEYDANKDRFKTMYGKHSITEE